MSKEYIKRSYKNAFLDYQLAYTDDEKYAALREMSSLEVLASNLYGFDFADSLQKECMDYVRCSK